MSNLFVYGTLMCEDIIKAVAGCVPEYKKGALEGYKRRALKNEHFPGITADPADRVEGLVYFDISGDSWQRLDGFEGDMYERQSHRIELENGAATEAYVYVVRPEYVHLLDSRPWSFAQFKARGKMLFVNQYRGYDAIE